VEVDQLLPRRVERAEHVSADRAALGAGEPLLLPHLEGTQGTSAKTRVLITSGDGHETWGTVGVGHNIIEASWQALVDSVDYKLRMDEKRAKKEPSKQPVTGKP